MPELSEIQIRRDQWSKSPKTRLFMIRVPEKLTAEYRKMKQALHELTGVKLTEAFVFREGAKLYLEHLRVQIAKTKRGEYHAKKRPELNAMVRHYNGAKLNRKVKNAAKKVR